MITAIVLFSLLATVIYFYVKDTTSHFVHSVKMTGRMIFIVVIALLVLIVMIYTWIKHGTVL